MLESRLGIAASLVTVAGGIWSSMYFLFLVPTADKLDIARKSNEGLTNKVGQIEGERNEAQKLASDSQTTAQKAKEDLDQLNQALKMETNARTKADNRVRELEGAFAQREQTIKGLEGEKRSLQEEAVRLRSENKTWEVKTQELEGKINALQSELKTVGDMKITEYLDKEKADHEQLKRLADSDAIKKKFGPFLTKSRYRIGNNKQMFNEPRSESWSHLQKLGATRDYSAFARVGAGFGPDSNCNPGSTLHHDERPTWPCPQNPAQYETHREDYELFKRLGPIWVELGDLEP